MAESFNTLMERQEEDRRLVRESQLMIESQADDAAPAATAADRNQASVHSADEALRLLDSVTV
jgi:hypothetical protein